MMITTALHGRMLLRIFVRSMVDFGSLSGLARIGFSDLSIPVIDGWLCVTVASHSVLLQMLLASIVSFHTNCMSILSFRVFAGLRCLIECFAFIAT